MTDKGKSKMVTYREDDRYKPSFAFICPGSYLCLSGMRSHDLSIKMNSKICFISNGVIWEIC